MEADCGFTAKLEAARAGKAWALTALYRGLHARLLRYLAAFDPEHADDLASEVWLDIAAGLDHFEGDERAFRSWSFTIARRRLADARRLLPVDALGERGDAPDLPQPAEADLAVRTALERIGSLPHQDAEAILLRVVGGFTADEVRALLHRPAPTVRSLQQRAIQRLIQVGKAEAA